MIWTMWMAMSTFAGACCPRPFSFSIAVTVVATALLLRSPPVLCLGTALAASCLSANAWAALDEPLPVSVSAVGKLVADPQRERFGAVVAEISVDRRRYVARADGSTGWQLLGLRAGEGVYVEGHITKLTGITVPYLRRRHVAGRIEVEKVKPIDRGDAVAMVANNLRDTLERGASSMSEDKRALLTGFVYGDDRNQSPEEAQRFRDAGLSHLLAVSGQNVAFVLLLIAPLLSRMRMTGRLFAGLCVLVIFGFLTRWEPSVVRAEAMAVCTMVATYLGRPTSRWRVLSLATTLAVLVDPFLVGSIGFLMSLTACIGMAAFGPLLSSIVPGPLWLRTCAGYSAAAQLGVAPVQLAVFDGLPVVSVVANVLVEPVAGLVMTWGLAAGLIAGIVGGMPAELLHIPTSLMIGWIQWVARHCAEAELGNWDVHALSLAVLTLSVRLWWMARPLYFRECEQSASRVSREGRRSFVGDRSNQPIARRTRGGR